MNKEEIKNFINSDKIKLNFKEMLPIRDVEKILKELGYDELKLEGEETNGWQVDFWYHFNGNDLPSLCLSGSLHYGDFILSKSDV